MGRLREDQRSSCGLGLCKALGVCAVKILQRNTVILQIGPFAVRLALATPYGKCLHLERKS
ncbi:hypothetical protein SAMN04244570_2530 [Sporosarcina newyorkensis]|uniref:Uncharacterized protein n=1 Tax=Sporosarcina newyorkensis TaxID=759851 RepID=A0A1T4YH56_9BACL|nr:hypothetical protein SAMN04244570_2530 [Sporosarcina newyorkensis]